MSPSLIQEIEDRVVPPEPFELTPVEANLRQLLLDVAQHIEKTGISSGVDSQVNLSAELARQPIVLRFTGGWVRDKLLGLQSHDIDVAINKMTGYQFGLRMKEFLEISGNPEKYGLDGVAATEKQSQQAGTTDKSKTVGGLHKIEANPEKSKHLETVTTRIMGLDVDLVNLRRETYTEDSRNPQMEFGTPEEDALRRDATVNAIFYNINNQQIEDYTGKGYNDMAERLIRTPLEPYQTFKDDPLRVLRLIRFASRLNYKIEPNALGAMSDPDIKDALRRKISRERIGTEIDKALRGPDPHEALRLIFELGLYETVFSDPTQLDHYMPNTTGWETIIDCLQDVMHGHQPLSEFLVRDKDEQFLAWALAALVPYRDAPLSEPTAPGRKPLPPTATQVAREGIKATNKISDIITAAVNNQGEISNLVDNVFQRKRRPDKSFQGEDVLARDLLGMSIRKWGPTWRSQVIYSFLVDVVETEGGTNESVELIERKYTTFVQYLAELEVLDVYNLKPLLDGKTLAKALDTPPGPWMKGALEVVLAWQLRNPGINDVQDAIDAVRRSKESKEAANETSGELTFALALHFLKLTIRPLFAKVKPSNVTDTGHKVTTAKLPSRMTKEIMDDSVNKPWKSGTDAFALDLLKWVVVALNEKVIIELWHLVVPPVLTLVDDWETKYKRLGAALLQEVLQVTPPFLMERTGLDEVFEDALMPCLTYMPPLTPEEDAVELLSAVYPALLALSHVRFATQPHPSNTHVSSELVKPRVKFLDMVLRKGVIYGFSYCTEYPRLNATLSDQLRILLNELGIESVKHLKHILPLLNDTLSHPLANMDPRMLLSAVKTMQSIILNSWPRMPEHRGDVLKGLTLCWLGVEGQEGEHITSLRSELQTAVMMLSAVLENTCDVNEEFEHLCAADARLGPLLHRQSSSV